MAQLVKCPTLVKVMISQFMSLCPESGSVQMAWNLEPASDSVSLSVPPLLVFILSLSLSLCLSLSKINKNIKKVVVEVHLIKKDLTYFRGNGGGVIDRQIQSFTL